MATGSISLICICKPFAYIAVFFKTVFTGKQVDVDVERKQRSLNHRRKLHRATHSCTLPDQLHDMYGLTCHYHTVERWLKQGRFMHRWPTLQYCCDLRSRVEPKLAACGFVTKVPLLRYSVHHGNYADGSIAASLLSFAVDPPLVANDCSMQQTNACMR